MNHVDKHWQKMEERRTEGRLPANAFDFISIHHCALPNPTPYSLVSPLCLVDDRLSMRPPWEDLRWVRKSECVAYARQLVRYYANRGRKGLYLVDCA